MRGRNDRIAVLREVERAPSAVRAFLDVLGSAGFRGEIENDHAIRTVLSTDNSIYQRFPQAAIFPADDLDVALAARLAGEERFRSVVLTPRGGGTGTNGQSLTDGIVVDLSRHLNRILEVNVEERWVRVQPGVVKDQLNAAVAPYGLFFAPELSTSNRATIGGMISTDASGQGSCTYGKTRDHVLALETVLIGGERFSTRPLCDADLRQACEKEDRSGEILRCLREIVERDGERIDAVFPELNRCLTGYDLRHLRNDKGDLDPNSVICGSEGTLGFLVEAKLNLLVVPTFSVLVNIRYRGFMDALRDARSLLHQAPLSIETVDSKVLGLAKDDIVWGSVAEYFPDDAGETAAGINLVEFAGHDMHEVEQRLDLFLGQLDLDRSVPRLGYTVARGREAVRRVYAMRKRAVGLLGNVEGEARPQPFVEDTAVPPERLADFIGEFRALLDGHDLDYGMFGHVDAGVLHVRPLLNMRDPGHRALIRPISDAVEALTRRYGGLLWGEHGKGVRSEYVTEVFGELYPVLQQIKTAFDPSNQMNPGKIATPSGAVQDLLRVDGVPMRGQTDQGIEESVWQSFGTGVHCNGNGACYNHDADDPMCPSWKATRNRIHSPKGRASLLREWLRLQGKAGVELMGGGAGSWRLKRHRTQQPDDFSHQVYDAMAGCLACKSCATQCPVKVDVPDFRSRFLHLYHTRYVRPLRDYVVGGTEHALPWLSRIAPLYNAALGLRPVRFTLEKFLGLVDTPKLARFDFKAALTHWNVMPLDATVLSRLSASERGKSVILMPDMFTRYFEPHLLEAFMAVATKLGFQVFLAPARAGGKPLHVHGFLRAFSRVARRQIVFLQSMEKYGVPIVGFDPAMTLIYRQEYRKIEPDGMWPKVMLLQEWLLEATRSREPIPVSRAYRLMLHCTEKTSQPQAASDWREVFAAFGLQLSEESTGCCGMSGTYGHEQRNRETSAVIFGQSWGRLLDVGKEHSYLATGFSCRSQVRRERSMGMLHPVEILNDMLAVS